MKIEKIKDKVNGIPHMTFDQAKKITNIIMENKCRNILELGFRFGVSTCYMAGALDELGEGKITTIDLQKVRKGKPNIEQLLGGLGLAEYVTVFYEPTSYIWRLMKILEEDPVPRYDFCYIDGAHDWFTDGFAFFLVDRLLKPGGLIVFDDLDWTYEASPSLKNTEKVKLMPEEERSTPQIRKVFEILVVSHPSYIDFVEKDGWAYARKKSEEHKEMTGEVRKQTIYEEKVVYKNQNIYVGLGGIFVRIFKKVVKKLKGKVID